MKYLISCMLRLLLSLVCVTAQTLLIHRWKTPVFTFPSENAKQQLTQNGSYIPNTGVLLDVDRHAGTRRTFVTLPHLNPSTSVTLAVVSNNYQQNDPLLSPYPDWSWHQPGNCDGLISVFRVKVDSCNRLWVLDSGVDDVANTSTRTCPPKIMIFNLWTNKLINKYVIPPSNVVNGSLFVTVEVEAEPLDCQNAYAYLADVSGFTMVVYSLAKNRSWLVNSTSFAFDPAYNNITISGVSFSPSDGLLGLALSKRTRGDYQLFYHSLNGVCENYVYTSVLKNESNFPNGVNLVPNEFHECFRTRPGQSAAEAIDNNGNLFFGVLPDNAIDCFNVNNRFDNRSHRVERNDRYMQFVGGMKAPPPFRLEIWTISCRFQIIWTTGLNRSEYNFHILRGSSSIMALLAGCQYWPFT